MTEKKLKYQTSLAQFSNCPPFDYTEIQGEAFRWVHQEAGYENDFKPMHLINTPPERRFDESDYMCKGYGLSLFDTLNNSINAYKSRHASFVREKQRQHFIEEKGNCIATLAIHYTDGIASDPNPENYGHFTFHEYDATDLTKKIIIVVNIINVNGNFIN